MRKKKLILSGLILTFSAAMLLSNADNANAFENTVWDKKLIDCTFHYGTQCTGSGLGCDMVACKQYQNPQIQ